MKKANALIRWNLMAASCLTGTMVATSCTTDQMQLVAAGIEAVLRNYEEDDDISFGDWLESELDD